MTGSDTYIGAYRIAHELGRGGMGVVYLARDSRLDRDVAIKALPEHLTNAPDRLARFQREAKVLASLNHPSIGAIYGIEEANGQQYLVLEYIEGATLDEALSHGPLPLDDAIEIAVKIAEALEAAHEKGVIHRDLKPGNIMVTPDGAVKVLDFGLARTTEATSSRMAAAASPDSPTVTSPMPVHSPTIPGAIMGTAGYMSPEQARGKPVDKRSDIFSFGCVLYEMLTGVPPFRGETVADSIGATLHKEIDQSRLPPDTPSNVRRVLHRCLMKNNRDRLHDVADARIELESRIAEDSQAFVPAGSRFSVASVVLAFVFCVAAVGAAVWYLKPDGANLSVAPPPLPVFDAHITLPAGERLGHSMYPGLAISRDGRTVAFPIMEEPTVDDADPRSLWLLWMTRAGRGIMVRHLDEPGLMHVPGTDDQSFQPVFSPDGEWIAFVSGTRDVYKAPVSGGRPIRLATTPTFVAGLAWADDDTIIIGQLLDYGLMQVPAAGGSLSTLTPIEGSSDEGSHGLPHALPGGGVLYTAYPRVLDRTTSIWAFGRATGERIRLIEDAAHGQYANGHIVFIREGNLMAVPFDPHTLRITGEARQLGESAVQSKYYGHITMRTSAGQFALSPSGAMAIAEGTVPAEANYAPVWLDRDGTETPLEVPGRSYLQAHLSTDGTKTLLSSEYMPNSAIWLHDNERHTTRRVFSPILFVSAFGPGPDEVTCLHVNDEGHMQLGTLPIGGTRVDFSPIEVPAERKVVLWPAEWSRDGRRLLAMGRSTAEALTTATIEQHLRIWMYDREDGWSMLSREISYAEICPTFSPDGRWLAYASNETGEWEVYVRPMLESGGTGPAQQVSIGGGGEPRWSHDGKKIYYRAIPPSSADREDQSIYSVKVAPLENQSDRLNISRPELIINITGRYIRITPVTSWALAPDGRFLFIKFQPKEVQLESMRAIFPDRIRVIQNWASRLDRR